MSGKQGRRFHTKSPNLIRIRAYLILKHAHSKHGVNLQLGPVQWLQLKVETGA
jgi:hypothetical protein